MPLLHARCRSTIAASLEGLEKVTTTSKAKEENTKRIQVKCKCFYCDSKDRSCYNGYDA